MTTPTPEADAAMKRRLERMTPEEFRQLMIEQREAGHREGVAMAWDYLEDVLLERPPIVIGRPQAIELLRHVRQNTDAVLAVLATDDQENDNGKTFRWLP